MTLGRIWAVPTVISDPGKNLGGAKSNRLVARVANYAVMYADVPSTF